MSEGLSRLQKLRVVREWQAHALARTDAAIAEEEQRHAALQRPAPTAAPPLHGGEWAVGLLRKGGRPVPAEVHRGDCRMHGGRSRPLTREEAIRAMTVDDIPPCPYCRPETDLGLLDG
ncbi:hypothetical protein J3A78_003848 [Streptomyces sp. PvR006]|uniref:DUF6233 domain-containing protein n=1 Tax=Streptomyces sp. PvR006 TaxID=2817860 RepID=UPI001AE800C1|nr:DUF6233 domain-containing protein [Streptomyces sp. PvR006]MBP2583370.1 hypothetical protein [Streptomyces sp. PvR006]